MNTSVQKSMQNLIAKIMRSASFMFKAFQRAVIDRNPIMADNRSKYRLSPMKVKYGTQAVCLRTQAVSIEAPL